MVENRDWLKNDGLNTFPPSHSDNETEVLLGSEDFSVWLVFATLDELQSLEKQKIPISEWQEISLEPEEGVTPLPIYESDLSKKETF